MNADNGNGIGAAIADLQATHRRITEGFHDDLDRLAEGVRALKQSVTDEDAALALDALAAALERDPQAVLESPEPWTVNAGQEDVLALKNLARYRLWQRGAQPDGGDLARVLERSGGALELN